MGLACLAVALLIFGVYLSAVLHETRANHGLILIDATNFETSSTRTNPQNGLELILAQNATVAFQGQYISVMISENNTMNSVNNVSLSDEWFVPPVWLGCPSTLPINIQIFEGYYSTSNASLLLKAEALESPSVVMSCFSQPPPASYVFLPSGNFVNFTSGLSCAPGVSCASPMVYNLALNGTSNSKGGENDLNLGTYTVLGEDEWGQIALLHFAVSNVRAVTAETVPAQGSSGSLVEITLMNAGNNSIISLNATLGPEPESPESQVYHFSFPVSASHPLEPTQIVEDSQTLTGVVFASGQTYYLSVADMLENGVIVIYVQAVSIVTS